MQEAIIKSPVQNRAARKISVSAILIILPVALFFISFLIGRYPATPLDVIAILLSKILPIQHTWPDVMDTVVFQIRLPRLIAAMLVGASLSISGAAFQGVFRNPLVSPQILGVSSGAGFGAALAIFFFCNSTIIQGSAFVFGLAAVGLTYLISKTVKGSSTLVLVLGGIAIGAFFSALISIAKCVADPYDQLPSIVFWLMGSLAALDNIDVLMVAGPIVLGIIVLLAVRWKINTLAMGDEEAQAMGVDTKKLRAIIIICCTIITAASVSISGMIGWVGLVIPHIGRMLVGPDHKKLLPACIAIGAFYLLLVDNIARAALSVEIPLGILTAMVGAPFFIYLLRKNRRGWA
jgi:iron complex transport system permease protein